MERKLRNAKQQRTKKTHSNAAAAFSRPGPTHGSSLEISPQNSPQELGCDPKIKRSLTKQLRPNAM